MALHRRGALWATALLAATASVAASPPDLDREAWNQRITADLELRSSAAARLWKDANAARERDEHGPAAALYRGVLELVPDFVHAKRRLAGAELALGNRTTAIKLGRQALAADASTENMVGLALGLSRATGPRKPTEAELKEAKTLAATAAGKSPEDPYAHGVLAQVSLVTNDMAGLKKATERLIELAPEQPTTHQFAAFVAVAEERFADAQASLDRARKAGMPEEQYQAMTKAFADSRPPLVRFGAAVLYTLGAWVGALVVLLTAGFVLSRAVLREAESLPTQASGRAQGGGATLKKAYSVVLYLSCAYYYVSMPILVLLVLLTGGGVIYGFFAIGRIPIKLTLIIVVVVLATIWSMLKSLFVRGSDEDPGERLDLRAHPRFRSMLGDVARRIGTRPVDNVYLTPGTELAVMERGGVGRQLRGRTERCLILGIGVLEGLKLGPFKAVLAHEYGHFTNKDTAGGGFALAVRRSLFTMAQGLAQSGAGAWYNPAWLFLNVFYRAFLLISQGASRLQEILADRWAAFTYGSKAFEEGLRHVISQSVRFDARAGAALKAMAARSVSNLYQHQPETPIPESEVEKAVRETLNRPASAYDSHPSPTERSRWVRTLNARGSVTSPDDETEVWGLFADRQAIEERMTAHVHAMILAAQAAEAQAAAQA